MRININSKKFTLTDALDEYARRRLNFSLSNKSESINKVVMRLSDINGPRGGSDMCCHLQIVLKGMADVVVEDTQVDMYSAIDRACDRASRTVVRKVGRQQTIHRAVKQIIPFNDDEEVLA